MAFQHLQTVTPERIAYDIGAARRLVDADIDRLYHEGAIFTDCYSQQSAPPATWLGCAKSQWKLVLLSSVPIAFMRWCQLRPSSANGFRASTNILPGKGPEASRLTR